MCHNFGLWLFEQDQGPWKKVFIVFVWYVFLFCYKETLAVPSSSHSDWVWPNGCLGLDPQSCVQVQGHCKRKCTNPSWPYFVMEKDRKLNFDTKIAWDLNICPDLELWPSASSQEKIMAFQQMKYLHVLSEDIICELVLFFFT